MHLQHRLSPLVLAIGVFVGQPRSLRAAEPEPEPVIDIEVDAADLPATRAELANIVSTEVNRALAEQDSLPAGVFVADDRRVLVELHPSPIPGSDEVLIHVEVQLGGERLAESTTETCLSCTDAGVADKVLLLLTPLLPKLPAPTAPAAPAPAIEEHEAETLDTRPPPLRRELLTPAPRCSAPAWLASASASGCSSSTSASSRHPTRRSTTSSSTASPASRRW